MGWFSYRRSSNNGPHEMRFFFFFLLFLFSLSASAYEERWYQTSGYGTGPQSTPEAACSDYVAGRNSSGAANAPFALSGISDITFRQKLCQVKDKNNGDAGISIYRQYRCNTGEGSWTEAQNTPPACYEEPQPPETCEAGRVLDSLSVSNFNSVEPTNIRCISGCYAPLKVSLQSQFCYPAGPNYPAGCVIPAYFEWIDNGLECEGGSDPWASTSPDPLPPQPTEPPNCPECDCIKSGQGYGTVNGAVVCVGLGSEGSKPVEFKGAPTVTTTTPAPTPENPNPEPVTTVTSSTSSTTVGASTGSGSSGAGTDNPQVTTTTTDENGATIETTQDKESFCSSNPTHALCQPKTDCDKYPDSIACQIMGDAPELGEGDGIPTIEREVSLIVKPSLPEAAGCPAPLNISIGGHSITVSFQPFCDYAEAFRPLVIASAWLSAALIVVGFRGNE